MYGGDEIGAIVIDVGTATTKSGYAGDDAPKYVFPTDIGVVANTGVSSSTVGDKDKMVIGEERDPSVDSIPHKKYFIGSSAVTYQRNTMEIKNPLENGLVKDWELLEQIYNFTFKESLRVDPSVTPLLLAEPSFNTKGNREKLTQLMFEKFQTPALFVGKNGVLSSFASGKSTSLVVECGAGYTAISPVIDGYIIQKSIISSPFSGNALTNELMKLIEREKKVEIRPRYMIASKRETRPGFGEFEVELKSPTPITTASFRQFSTQQIVSDIKENVCRLLETRFDESSNSNVPGVSYELPDGQSIDLGIDRYKIPELLFTAPPISATPTTVPPSISIPQMILTSVAKCDADTRRELYNSIVLTGGTTLLPSFSERLLRELQPRVPQMYKVKMLATSAPVERKQSVFIGGSILASLGTFHQMWISKAEYEEHGASIIEKKCP